MGSFLLKEKNGVFWRTLKGSAIFALGFYTHDALTPDLSSLIKEAEQFSAKAKSLAKMSRAKLAELQKCNKVLDDLMQLYTARIAKLEIAKLEELKKADRRYTVGTCCESQKESVWSFI